jgi:carboxypeptidase Q
MPVFRSYRGLATLMVLGAAACSIRHPGEVSTPVPASPPAGTRPAAAAAPSTDTAARVAQEHITLPSDSALVRAMIAEGTLRPHVAADLEYLSDVIGPRLTGSAAVRRANTWTVQKFREYGLDSVWTETWRFGRSWERGPLTLALVAPHARQLIGASWAWAPGTDGPETGDVVYVDALTPAEYSARFASSVNGKWVMTRPPVFVWNPDGPPMTAADSARADAGRRAFAMATSTPDLLEFRQGLPFRLASDGALGLINDGAKDFGLLTMSGSPSALFPLPMVVVPHETFTLFHRLLAAGQKVTLRADIANSLSADTVDAQNTVAELRGSTKPEEVVLVGAHLDSWDLATGTTDNGAGAMAVLEAARILKASGAHPARTIRFVLFTGEEEGLYGSQAYAEQHERYLKNYQAALVIDNGTGRITGMSLQGHDELRDGWRAMFGPIESLGPFAVRSRDKGGTDHLSFIPYGVPAFNYDQETRGYNHTHHSQSDTYDYAVPGDLQQAATVMAVNAYELATIPEFLTRGKATIVVGADRPPAPPPAPAPAASTR